MGEYEVPLDEQLRIQATEQIVCTDLCMFRDHCDGFCIANQEWKESIIFETAVLTATPFCCTFAVSLHISNGIWRECRGRSIFHQMPFDIFSIFLYFFHSDYNFKKTIWRKGD